MTPLKTLAALVLSALAVSACGERPSEKNATQVAARVNGGEISVHQINFVLQRNPNLSPAQAEAAKKQILEGLIDQELAVQQAVEGKLDRTPAVMEAIEAARREILARAYVERVAGNKGKPSAAEIKQFYADHPELFSNRKIYRLEEASFVATPDRVAGVKEQLGKGKPVSEVLAWLKGNGVEVVGGTGVKPAEQLALEFLPQLAIAKEGQTQVFENDSRAAIITVLASKAEPIDEVKALPIIENYLLNKQRVDLARDSVKQLRDKAKIEYLGEFSGNKPAPAEKTSSTNNDPVLNKGIAGLK